jgi:hypothetical protein
MGTRLAWCSFKTISTACQAKATDQKPIKVENALPKPTTDYMSLAIKIAKSLHQKTSLGHVEKVAKTLFKFDLVPPLHVTMPDVVAQEIFDWIITLGAQPIDENDKIRLVKEFTSCIAPKSSSAEKSAES